MHDLLQGFSIGDKISQKYFKNASFFLLIQVIIFIISTMYTRKNVGGVIQWGGGQIQLHRMISLISIPFHK